jgi:hypothetical protein
MNLTEIKDMALSLSDRTDSDLPSRLDAFLTLFEARANRILTTQGMEQVSLISWISDANVVYPLPAGIRGIRSVKKYSIGSQSLKTNYHLANQEMLDNHRSNGSELSSYVVYSNSIEIYPNITSTEVLELTTTNSIAPLTALSPTNWLSVDHSDVYIMGLLAEVAHFAKDKVGFEAYWARINEAFEEIRLQDERLKWSGNPAQTRVG